MKAKLIVILILVTISVTSLSSKYLKSNNPKVNTIEHHEEILQNKYEVPAELKNNILRTIGNSFSKEYEIENTLEGIYVIDKDKVLKKFRHGIDTKGYIAKIDDKELISKGKEFEKKAISPIWLINPSIKIDKDIIMNQLHLRVCRIEVINCSGELVNEYEITAKDFLNLDAKTEDGFYYDGELKNEFNDMSVGPGFYFANEVFKSRGVADCKFEVRIYWLGKCDLWIENVKIENEFSKRIIDCEFDFILSSMEDFDFSLYEKIKRSKDLKMIKSFLTRILIL